MANASVKVYLKRKIQVEKLNFSQVQMLKLGTVGVNTIVQRAQAALNVNDTAAKPLSRRYAIAKMFFRRDQKRLDTASGTNAPRRAITGKRDLTLTGRMLANLKVRTVSANRASAQWASRLERQKASNNERLEHFVDFSKRNEAKVVEAAEKILGTELVPRLLRQSFT